MISNVVLNSTWTILVQSHPTLLSINYMCKLASRFPISNRHKKITRYLINYSSFAISRDQRDLAKKQKKTDELIQYITVMLTLPCECEQRDKALTTIFKESLINNERKNC